MGNCCLSSCGLLDLFLDWSDGDPRVLCHTLSIHPPDDGAARRAGSPGCIVGGKPDMVAEYELGEELGKGQFGVIRRCTHRASGERLACKSIAKCKLSSAGDVRDVQREIDILRHLSGHPNVVQLRDVFEDEENVHLLMELCDGGELFDRIVQRRSSCGYTEPEAARLLKTLIQVLDFCHQHGVIHRDLKPENILFGSGDQLKLADFGLAVHFQPGETHSGMAGSAYYIAPEVLRGEYAEQVDVWSAGVVLYVLLSGVPPFWDETEEGIFEAIRYGHLDLASDPWPHRSAAAKDLIRGMLCPDVRRRLTPRQILEHEWIVKHTSGATPTDPLRVELPPPSTVDLSSSWRSWKTLPSATSSDTSCAGSDEEEEEDDECNNANRAVNNSSRAAEPSGKQLARWSSLTQVTEPTIGEFLAVMFKDGGDKLLHSTVLSQTSVNSNNKASMVVSCSRGRFLVVHDRERKRIGWKQLLTTSPPAASCEDRLLWSPFPLEADITTSESSSRSS